MATSLIYRNWLLYESAMLLLYGRHYFARHRLIADLIPPHASVLELCCGPALLYLRHLRFKRVNYQGLDINPQFIRPLSRKNIAAQIWDLQSARDLPPADYVIMQASLYHFLPHPNSVVDRMLSAARKQVIIAEPIKNLSDSTTPLISTLARRFSQTSKGTHAFRFTEQSLDCFFEQYQSKVHKNFLIPGGREKVYVLTP